MRTREQVIAECEARMAELQAEAQTTKRLKPCRRCVHHSVYLDSWTSCHHPLVVGFGQPVESTANQEPKVRLCGPEKALWVEQVTIRDIIKAFFKGLFA